ncbi:unnamed protein product, partial [Didymodactylos carnosus]
QGIEYLNENGYAVFADVLAPDEITANIDLFWEYLENLPAPYHIRRDESQTWDAAWPGLTHVGIMPSDGIPHSQFMWCVRGNPHNPIEKSDRCSIQGFVALTDNNEYTGGLVVVPESHKHFADLRLVARNNSTRPNFARVRKSHALLKRFKPRLVKCQAGDLVVFDSRCIHCNTPALQSVNETEEATSVKTSQCSQLLRLVAYVCMSPTTMVPSDQLEQFRKTREEFVKNRISCTHWPCELNVSGK